jgi:hypothetical protein
MANELLALLQDIGLTQGESQGIQGALGEMVDTRLLAEDDAALQGEGGLGAVLPLAIRRKLHEREQRMTGVYETVYGAAVAAIMAAGKFRPNSQVRLQPSVGSAAVAAGTPVQLFVVRNGAVTTNSFALSAGMRIYAVVTGPVDSAAGWTFSNVQFADDAVGAQTVGDSPFYIYQIGQDFLLTPLGFLQGKKVISGSPVALTVFAVHNAAAPIAMTQGVTVSFFDDRCMTHIDRLFSGPPAERFPSVVREIRASLRPNLSFSAHGTVPSAMPYPPPAR